MKTTDKIRSVDFEASYWLSGVTENPKCKIIEYALAVLDSESGEIKPQR